MKADHPSPFPDRQTVSAAVDPLGPTAAGARSYDVTELVSFALQPNGSLRIEPLRHQATRPVPMACPICGGRRCAYCVGSGPRV